MGKRKLKTSGAWAKALGFTDVAIRVEKPGCIPMVVGGGGEEVEGEYIRPYVFTLMGALDDEAERGEWDNRWREVGRVELVRFMGGKALNDDIDLWAEADAEDGDLEAAASVFYGNMRGDEGFSEAFHKLDMVLFQAVWVEPEFRGKGVAEQLFRRALAFQDDSSLACVLVFPEAEVFFREGQNASDPLAGADHGDVGRGKLARMLEGWGFEAVPGHDSSVLWFIVDDMYSEPAFVAALN